MIVLDGGSHGVSRSRERARITLPHGLIDRYLADCFAAEDVPRAYELAARCGMTPAQLTRAFLRERGKRPAEYLKARQVVFAKRLLTSTSMTTTAIAYRAGFGTRATFFRVFRRLTGETPAQFRQRRRPEAA